MNYFFPLDASKISWSSKLKAKWDVTSFRSAGQMRKAIIRQDRPLWTFSIDFPQLSKSEVDELLAFHAARRGSWQPFLYKDFERYAVIGKTLQQDASMKYIATVPFGGYEEPAAYIDNVRLWVDGQKSNEFTVSGGLISTTATGEEMKFDYEYYFKVVFADQISVNQIFYNLYSVGLTLEVVQ